MAGKKWNDEQKLAWKNKIADKQDTIWRVTDGNGIVKWFLLFNEISDYVHELSGTIYRNMLKGKKTKGYAVERFLLSKIKPNMQIALKNGIKNHIRDDAAFNKLIYNINKINKFGILLYGIKGEEIPYEMNNDPGEMNNDPGEMNNDKVLSDKLATLNKYI